MLYKLLVIFKFSFRDFHLNVQIHLTLSRATFINGLLLQTLANCYFSYVGFYFQINFAL